MSLPSTCKHAVCGSRHQNLAWMLCARVHRHPPELPVVVTPAGCLHVIAVHLPRARGVATSWCVVAVTPPPTSGQRNIASSPAKSAIRGFKHMQHVVACIVCRVNTLTSPNVTTAATMYDTDRTVAWNAHLHAHARLLECCSELVYCLVH